jgi:hypothetical protein
MAYPPAPWNLQGYGIQAVHLIDIDRSRLFVPPELKIIPILPGKTLGGVYLASYEEGSVLKYSELIVVSAIVQHANKIGIWISHIYVDNPDSVMGGREIWGLPKELAQFKWNIDEKSKSQVRVFQDDRELCTLNFIKWSLPGIQLPISGNVFSTLNSKLLTFQGRGKFNTHLVGANLKVPSESPFAQLNLGQGWLCSYNDSMLLDIKAPSVA